MLTEEQSRKETDRVLRLMQKFDPREAQNLPKGDFYVRPSTQKAIWTSVAAGFSLVIFLLAILWLAAGVGADFAGWLVGIGVLLIIPMIYPALVEWRLCEIQPIYGSHRLGQVWIGQRTEPWMLRSGGSSPDTVYLEREDINTPDVSWWSRIFFKLDQLVESPKGRRILMRDGVDDLYRIRDYWIGKRNQSNEANIESRGYQEATYNLLSRHLSGGDLEDKIRQMIREELQAALAQLPRQVVEEFAKSFEVNSGE
ncbi:MAG: hypothetical protein WBO49_01325 [Candidatus Saccharimonas sp.]